jgi:AcrR family transcriptional regulator
MAAEFRTTSQAERRRATLVQAAAHLAVTEGIEAVHHARVAELAECARSLVYRYFPSREDLLYSIISTFRSQFAERMPPEQIIKGITALKSARPGRVPDATQEMIDALWPTETRPDVSEDVIFAALMLLRGRNLGLAIGKHEAELHRMAEEHWQRPFAEIGLGPEESSILMDCVLALHDHIARGAMSGSMTRERAVDLYVRTLSALIKALADSPDRVPAATSARR